MMNNLNLNQLRVFHAVASFLNFTRASEELHLTQPGISKHIKKLESFYGTKLFDRVGKKVILTQAGEVLFKTTGTLFGLLQESKACIDDLRGLVGGKLMIGASISIGTYILPEMLVQFRKKHPNVQIKVEMAQCEQIVKRILDYSIELSFVGHCYESDKRLSVKPFHADPMLLIVSKKHPWAKRRSVRLQDLANEPFLLSRKGSGTRNIVEEVLDKAGVALSKTMELGTTEAVKQAVKAGLGVSILSKHLVKKELETGLIASVPLQGVNLKRDLYLVYHKDRYLSDAARAFLELVK